VLWLALGEQIRTAAFLPGTDALPPTVQRLIDTASELGVSCIPYIYPILRVQRPPGETPPWLYPRGGGKFYADLANREFQDYFVATVTAFSMATGALGAGYDYTYFEAPHESTYAQWAGWRRILTLNRLALSPLGDYVVDNRQASHDWSPHMWAAGSYAEPLQSDEQTTSWTAYVPDVHIDRTDGNRQRQMNYDYAQSKLCQPSAMPGFMHHNTDRCIKDQGCPHTVKDRAEQPKETPRSRCPPHRLTPFASPAPAGAQRTRFRLLRGAVHDPQRHRDGRRQPRR
jgi:hypothetical protein